MDPTAPILWGIDPREIFKWTPAEFRLPPVGWEARVAAIRPTIEEYKANAKARDTYEAKLADLSKEFEGATRPVKPGAPIVHLKPMSERLSLRVQAALATYERKLALAKQWLDEDAQRIEADSELSETDRADAILALERKATIENEDRLSEIFGDDLRFLVLSECVCGWENIAVEWTGKWEVDAQALLPKWKQKIFEAIRAGSVYSKEAQQGFTLPQDSVAA
jgi:hypothetical protein